MSELQRKKLTCNVDAVLSAINRIHRSNGAAEYGTVEQVSERQITITYYVAPGKRTLITTPMEKSDYDLDLEDALRAHGLLK